MGIITARNHTVPSRHRNSRTNELHRSCIVRFFGLRTNHEDPPDYTGYPIPTLHILVTPFNGVRVPTDAFAIFFPYLEIKNMNIDYKKCHANSILIVCMRFVPKNTMVNAVDYRNLNTLHLSVN